MDNQQDFVNKRFTTIISILGVIIACASVVASYAQYKAADLQARATISALMPQLQVSVIQKKDGTDYVSDQRIEISSEGGPIYNFYTEQITWFSINKNGKVILEQPLDGYFSSVHHTGKIKGEIQTISDYRNYKKYTNLQNTIDSMLSPEVNLSSPITIIKATYTDSMYKANEEYFLIIGSNVQRLRQSEILSSWSNATQIKKNNSAISIDIISKPEEFAVWVKRIK